MSTPPNPLDLAAEQLKKAEEAKAAAESAIKAAQLAAAEAAEEELVLLQKSIKVRQKAFEDLVEKHKAEMEALNSKVQKLSQISTSTTSPVVATPVATPAAAAEAAEEEEEAKASYDYRAVIALLVIVVGGLYLFFV